MINCNDILHAYGYNPSGDWVESYYVQLPNGDQLVLKSNRPPEGQWSQTPPSQVGHDNHLCIMPPEAPQAAIEVTQSPTPTSDTPTTPGGLGTAFLVIVAGCFIYKITKSAIDSHLTIGNLPSYRGQDIWTRLDDQGNLLPPVNLDSLGDQVPEVEPLPEETLGSDWTHSQLTQAAINHMESRENTPAAPHTRKPLRHKPDTVDTSQTRHEDISLRHDTDTSQTPQTCQTRHEDMPLRHTEHVSDTSGPLGNMSTQTPDKLGSIGPSTYRPFDPSQPEQPGEYDAYVAMITEDNLRPTGRPILKLWGASSPSNTMHQAAKTRRNLFYQRYKSNKKTNE